MIIATVPFLVGKVRDNMRRDVLLNNRFFANEFIRNKATTTARIVSTVNDIMFNGKDPKLALQQLQNIKDITKRDLHFQVRNMARSIQTDTLKKVYKANNVNYVRIVAVMDSSTTNFCRKIDGIVCPIEDAGQPPYHPNCRTTLMALTDEQAAEYEKVSFFKVLQDNRDDKDIRRLRGVFNV